MASSFEELLEERKRKLDRLKEAGLDPYPPDSRRTHSVATFLESFNALPEATIDGRVTSVRLHGGSMFLDICDGTGTVQAYLKKDELGEEPFDLLVDVLDSGDFLEVSGEPTVTRTGQHSLMVRGWRMLSKSLRPLPDAWFGLKDEEERYRRRYVDFLLNPEAAKVVAKRSQFWNTIRSYLLERHFIEVETPVLENTTGGADARPFVTHHNALDIDVFLRISAGELWQKKLLVGGFPRTFEIGRIFRNEGMSREHLQDYTQLEYYMAYADYRTGMEMVKEMYRLLADTLLGSQTFEAFGHTVDLSKDWEIYHFTELIQKEYNLDVFETSVDEVKGVLSAAGVAFDESTLNIERGIDLLWKRIRKNLSGPGFLIGVPVFMEPLAKRAREDNRLVERFQVILAGSEMGKGFSELNDPVDQRERFMHQQKLREGGDDEAHMADMEYVEALEYGMPPAFGFGVSERLFSFLLGIDVREGQLFPLMRPKIEE